MNTHIKALLATVGGAVALVGAVGFAPVDVSPAHGTPSTPPHSSSNVLPTRPGPALHHATLTGCISGENC